MPIFSGDVRKGTDKGRGEGFNTLGGGGGRGISFQSPKDAGTLNAYYFKFIMQRITKFGTITLWIIHDI